MLRASMLAFVALVLVCLGPFSTAPDAMSTAEHMCGNGATFTVQLPGRGVLPDGSLPPADSIQLPSDCAIYALLVSGYARNPNFDELTFYKFAKFVAEHNGYVHYAWWNNLLKPYMGGALHEKTITVPPFGTRNMTPGSLAGVTGAGFIPISGIGGSVDTIFPKAIPEEDDQFQADAELLLKAIRAHNPTAIIVVAGHSMGGSAVARLGANTDEVIDLLAPIDPVGNRTYPVGKTGSQAYNWTRWRAAHSFTGYRQVDCTREGVLCKDFDDRLLFKEYRCGPIGPLLDRPPLIASKAPGLCKGPWTDPGKRLKFKANIRHLLHRWQKENTFPFDFLKDEPFTYVGTDTWSVLGRRVFAQDALAKNGTFEADPEKTCAEPPLSMGKADPRDPILFCNSGDGHGEIVGFRGLDSAGAIPVGVQTMCSGDTVGEGHCQATCLLGSYCPSPASAVGRRAMLIEMATAPAPNPFKVSTDPPAWSHEPKNPNLDMVVDDMQRILEKILSLQPPETLDVTAPVTAFSLDPSPNEAGWHNTDVEVGLAASDNPNGSGVKEIDHALSGAQTAGTITSGSTAEDTITAEGVTTARAFARDNAGNAESLQLLDVRIDRTAPLVQAVPSELPNAAGWNKTNVLVHFTASDSLSGIAESSDDVLVSAEGATQEIAGSAIDNAGNEKTAAIVVSLDKTAPSITVSTPAEGAAFPLGSVANASYTCIDALSGMKTCEGPVPSGTPIDTSSASPKQFTVTATDEAGNVTTLIRSYTVVVGQPRLAITIAGKGYDASGRFFVDLKINNTGTGDAQAVVINRLVFRTLTGTGAVTLNTSLSPALPNVVGNLDAGSATTHRLHLNLPSTVRRFSIAESGSLEDVASTALTYSASQAIIR